LLLGKIDECIKDALATDGDSQISQNRMGYDEIEYNRNKDKGIYILDIIRI